VTPTYLGDATKAQQPAKRALEQAPAQQSYRPTSAAPCCAQAVRAKCVCIARWVCPVHGDHCFGSHE
jgi:hypothetical protein